MFKLRPYQTEAVAENRRLWSEGVRNPCTVLPTGAGKCHRKGTPILMFDGSIKAVEDVQVGDKLMGPDSAPRTVLALGRGTEMMYEVAQVKGEPYYVNESHILSLRKRGDLVNMPLTEYLTLTTSQKKLHYGWRVPGVLDKNTYWVKAPIRSVSPVGVEPYYGFEIDGDHLYLLGDFTVTHNTVVASELIRQEQQAGGYFAAIAHRQELVGQISLALARQGVMHDIVAPRPVVRFCSNQHVEELGQSFYSPSAPGFVGGVDTVIRREMGRIKNVVSLLFQDECFPAGTLIRTPSGDVPIESLTVGDTVMAFDENSGKFKARTIERLFKNPIKDSLVSVAIKPHHVLICTKGHPFFTKRGWVPAALLTTEDEVLYDGMEMYSLPFDFFGNDRESTLPLAQNGEDILHEGMWCGASENEQEKPRAESASGGQMLYVRESSRPIGVSSNSIQPHGEGVLFGHLFECVSGDAFEPDRSRNQSKIRIKSYESKQPYAEPRIPRENAANLDYPRACAENPWGERSTANGSGREVTGDVWASWFQITNDRIDWSIQTNGQMPQTLQGGLRVGGSENSDRSGRVFTYVTQSSRTGRPQRLCFNWTRLESVSLLEQSDSQRIGDGFTYNIEVREFHTYIANGVVVHNCHHVLRDNKWGKAAQLFPKANGLYVTATPLRADGKGLGRHADGLFDELIIGPSMRDLIRMGSLTDYRIFAPPTDIDLTNMVYGADGDYSRPELVKRAKKSGIIGDVVSNYEKYCEGMQTVVFTVDVEQAHDIAKAFEARGICAVALSANNTDKERQDAITAFRRKEIRVIVNVDLLGEGFDCPAIEAVIMARPTASYGLFVQVFGRALRLLDGKQFGLIIDMVGNVKRHGLPDAPRQWSLDRREKRGKSDANDGAPVKTCPECMGVYQVGPTRCPYCGHAAIATGGRGELVVVDAELRELTPEELAQLRGEADKLTREWAIPQGASKSQAMAIYSHNKTVRAQAELRDAVALWAGALRASGFTDDAIHVMMHRTYGTNVSALQVMRPKEAGELTERIMNDLRMLGVA